MKLEGKDPDRLRRAHKLFEETEGRDLFYKAATFLIELSLKPHPRMTTAESLAVLLQTWNREYYRFPRGGLAPGFHLENLRDIEYLVDQHLEGVLPFRERSLEVVTKSDADIVTSIFTDFELRLGRTGTSKALHLLAPRFFPLWETNIAPKAYHLYPRTPAAKWYLRLMNAVVTEINSYGGWAAFKSDENPVKLLDELHYCEVVLGLKVPA